MKFLCLDCDEPMKLHGTAGPDQGSLTVTFRCPECGFRVAMLTNPFETQMVRSLGVKVGGAPVPAEPFEHLRGTMANPRADVFGEGAVAGEAEATATSGGSCPFAAMLNEETPLAAHVAWTPEAEARIERIPSFIRPMAKKAIERFAEGKGYPAITEDVMDEARGALGM
jgi:DNA-directed RNA polymerase subunit RPC12/RpoP